MNSNDDINMNAMVLAAVDKLVYQLSERWQDEAGYEDIAEYRQPIQLALNGITGHKVVITAMSKRPFGFSCTFDDRTCKVWVKLTRRSAVVLCSDTTPGAAPVPVDIVAVFNTAAAAGKLCGMKPGDVGKSFTIAPHTYQIIGAREAAKNEFKVGLLREDGLKVEGFAEQIPVGKLVFLPQGARR